MPTCTFQLNVTMEQIILWFKNTSGRPAWNKTMLHNILQSKIGSFFIVLFVLFMLAQKYPPISILCIARKFAVYGKKSTQLPENKKSQQVCMTYRRKSLSVNNCLLCKGHKSPHRFCTTFTSCYRTKET